MSKEYIHKKEDVEQLDLFSKFDSSKEEAVNNIIDFEENRERIAKKIAKEKERKIIEKILIKAKGICW